MHARHHPRSAKLIVPQSDRGTDLPPQSILASNRRRDGYSHLRILHAQPSVHRHCAVSVLDQRRLINIKVEREIKAGKRACILSCRAANAWNGTMLRSRTTACRCIRTRLCKCPSSHRLHWHSCRRTAHYQPSCRRHTANRKSFARRLCPHSPNHPPWSNSQRYIRHCPACSRRHTPRPKPGAKPN
jgi:hypothetical protein